MKKTRALEAIQKAIAFCHDIRGSLDELRPSRRREDALGDANAYLDHLAEALQELEDVEVGEG